jgi:hypothetical protein
MSIVIEKDRAFGWIAVRDLKVELCTPHFKQWSDLALWAMQKYPAEPVGILASDIAGEPGALAAKLTTGCGILWMTRGQDGIRWTTKRRA